MICSPELFQTLLDEAASFNVPSPKSVWCSTHALTWEWLKVIVFVDSFLHSAGSDLTQTPQSISSSENVSK